MAAPAVPGEPASGRADPACAGFAVAPATDSGSSCVAVKIDVSSSAVNPVACRVPACQ